MTTPTPCPICGGRHATRNGLGRCLRYTSAWIRGHGDWALLAHCHVLTISLYGTQADAERARAGIDRTGCGHACARRHQIIRTDGLNLERGALMTADDRQLVLDLTAKELL
jgi:hypothetical protein